MDEDQVVARRPGARARAARVTLIALSVMAPACVSGQRPGRPMVTVSRDGVVGVLIAGGIDPIGATVDGAGRILVVGEAGRDGGDVFLGRFGPDGRPDPTFGPSGDGTVTVDSEPGHSLHDYGSAVAVLPDGAIVVAGSSGGIRDPLEPVRGPGRLTLWRFTGSGALDTAYREGRAEIYGAPGGWGAWPRYEVVADGALVQEGPASIRKLRTRTNGAATITSYGTNGLATTPGFLSDFAVMPGGSVVAAVRTGVADGGRLVGLTAEGRLDPAFGEGGVADLGPLAPDAIAPDGAGGVVVHAFGGSASLVETISRYTATGRPVVARELSVRPRPGTGTPFTNPETRSRLVVDRRGRVLIGGTRWTGDWNSSSRVAAVTRLTPDLLPDGSFGPDGVATITVPPDPESRNQPFAAVNALAVDGGDRVAAAAWNGRDLYVARLGP
jgi:uncharacterized delta-60 repeat protein